MDAMADGILLLIAIANLLALFYLLFLHLPWVLVQILKKARRKEPLEDDALALVAFILAVGGTGWIERTGWPDWVVYYVPVGITLLVFDWVIGTALFAWTKTLRKLESLRDTPDGLDYTLSLVRWGGPIRRLVRGKKAKAVFGFVPRYEMAVFRGRDVSNLYCVFHFADKATAEKMYHKIAQAIMEDGLRGEPLAGVMRNANQTKVDGRWAANWEPMVGKIM